MLNLVPSFITQSYYNKNSFFFCDLQCHFFILQISVCMWIVFLSFILFLLLIKFIFNIKKTKIMVLAPSLHGKQMGKQWKQWETIFLGSKITADGDCSHEIKTLAPWKKSYDQPRKRIKKQRHYFANKSLYSQSCGFSVVIYGYENWTIKKAEC